MSHKAGALTMERVSFAYPGTDRTVEDVSISVPKGEITALIGPNGSGKSTLFHLLTGRLKPQGGRITLGGREISNIRRRDFARRVSVVHQHNAAPADISVRRLVSMGRTAHGRQPRDTDHLAVERALQLTDTRQLADCEVSRLSGGQRQRVWLALALAQSTDILLLDEITAYLDIRYQIEMLERIRQLNANEGTTVLMVLHDIDQALEFSDNTIAMSNGSVLFSGKTRDVITTESIRDTFDAEAHILDIDGRRRCVFKYGKGGENEK